MSNLKQAYTLLNYSKISDDLYWIGHGFVLRMNVVLGKKNSYSGYKDSFHKEYKYNTAKYVDIDTEAVIRRSYSYFLTLEKSGEFNNSIMIRPNDMPPLLNAIEIASRWLSSDIFIKDEEDKLIVKGRPEPLLLDGFALNGYLMFEPIVIEYEDLNRKPGIRLTINDMDNFVDISLDNFYGFTYTMRSVNMVQMAQSMLAYIGRPEFGYNMSTVSDTGWDREEQSTPRTIKKTFFDR